MRYYYSCFWAFSSVSIWEIGIYSDTAGCFLEAATVGVVGILRITVFSDGLEELFIIFWGFNMLSEEKDGINDAVFNLCEGEPY